MDPQSQSGRYAEVDSIGTRTLTPRSSSLWPVAISTKLPRLVAKFRNKINNSESEAKFVMLFCDLWHYSCSYTTLSVKANACMWPAGKQGHNYLCFKCCGVDLEPTSYSAVLGFITVYDMRIKYNLLRQLLSR
jgi:hypothetical protein